MHILHSIEDFASTNLECVALTIGNFDGLHIGHQELIHFLTKQPHSSVVLTFSNHPTEFFTGIAPLELLSLEQKLHLLKTYGIHATLLLPFTQAFANQTAEEFLSKLKHYLNFKILVLGPDATIGRNREGNPAELHRLARLLSFRLHYVDSVDDEGLRVSSSRIRRLIQEGNLPEATRLLGHSHYFQQT